MQHLRGHAERRRRALEAAERAAGVVAALERTGVRCAGVTGGGAGSVGFDPDSGVFTELQPGSYAFMDRDDADNERGDRLRFEQDLFVATTVMSTAAGTHAVVGAGLKSLAVDSGLPALWPAAGSLRYVQANDEHGIVAAAAGSPLPPLGSALRLVAGHCDPTFDLHGEIVCLRSDMVECVWPVAARGLSR